MPYCGSLARKYFYPLSSAMDEFEINTSSRAAAFIAQIAHESGGLRYVREIASGDAYEGRADLGNTRHGDGVRYRGRGLIQITGRANYERAALDLDLDCVACPAVLEEPANACRVSAWFWKTHGLNDLADKGQMIAITRKINGGANGLEQRLKYWDKAKSVLTGG